MQQYFLIRAERDISPFRLEAVSIVCRQGHDWHGLKHTPFSNRRVKYVSDLQSVNVHINSGVQSQRYQHEAGNCMMGDVLSYFKLITLLGIWPQEKFNTLLEFEFPLLENSVWFIDIENSLMCWFLCPQKSVNWCWMGTSGMCGGSGGPYPIRGSSGLLISMVWRGPWRFTTYRVMTGFSSPA